MTQTLFVILEIQSALYNVCLEKGSEYFGPVVCVQRDRYIVYQTAEVYRTLFQAHIVFKLWYLGMNRQMNGGNLIYICIIRCSQKIKKRWTQTHAS